MQVPSSVGSVVLLAAAVVACRPTDKPSPATVEPTPTPVIAETTRTPAAAPAADASASSPADATRAIANALAHPDRLAADREIDARRHPGEILGFFGITPGMTVLDMFSGSGYYTEIVARTVGDTGKVWAHNNTPYLKWLADPITARYADDRLAFVHRFVAENNELELPEAKFDAVLMILTYHDIYHVQPQHGWPKIDGPKMMATIYRALKPGGVLGIVDHAAADGAPPETGEELHRIDPALARRELEAAGFVFEAESELLRNPQDDLQRVVLDPEVRGRTSRFIYRFRRP